MLKIHKLNIGIKINVCYPILVPTTQGVQTPLTGSVLYLSVPIFVTQEPRYQKVPDGINIFKMLV